MSLEDAKRQLDAIIGKTRVHFYKPVQIAEVLYHHRHGFALDFTDPESYRSPSKQWRDSVTPRLVGRVSTSSSRFQDNVFDENALPPALLAELGRFNEVPGQQGIVEAYIYRSLQRKLETVAVVREYVAKATPETFSLQEIVDRFELAPGLKRSIDKMYEISVYALFSTIVRALRVRVSLEIKNEDENILADFEEFIGMIIGITRNHTTEVFDAAMYRLGVTNAADRGLDMWSNFGCAVQVKHLTLDPELAETIAGGIDANRIVIVCRSADKDVIKALLEQVGWGDRIKGIVTLNELIQWYSICMSDKYKDTLGVNLLADLCREFAAEFPSVTQIVPFMEERRYTSLNVEGWM